jgi:psiF repeat-containing protein
MKISTLASAAIMTAFLMGGVAFAQTTAPAPAAKPAPAPVVHSAASIECSKEADAKGLHGEARKKFRAECKKNAAAPAPK